MTLDDIFAKVLCEAIDRAIDKKNEESDFRDKQMYIASILVTTYEHLIDARKYKREGLRKLYESVIDRLEPIKAEMDAEAIKRGYNK